MNFFYDNGGEINMRLKTIKSHSHIVVQNMDVDDIMMLIH